MTNSTRRIVAAATLLALAGLAPSSREEAADATPVPAGVQTPVSGGAAVDLVGAVVQVADRARIATAVLGGTDLPAPRRWPEDWPSLDPLTDIAIGRRAAAQDMIMGGFQVTIPPYTDPIGYDTPLDGGQPISDDPPTANGDAANGDADDGDAKDPARAPAGSPTVIQGSAGDLGRYPPGVTDQRFVQPTFDLPGTHKFRVAVNGAPWAIPTDAQVEMAGNGSGYINLDIDTRGLAPGRHDGTVVLTCVDHPGRTVEVPIGIDVPYPAVFGGHPADARFAGLDAAGQPKPLDDLLHDVIGDIENSPFSHSTNGARIVTELRSWEGSFTIVPTTDGPAIGTRAPGQRMGTASDGDVIGPGDGQYVRSAGWGPLAGALASEEFLLGVDQSSQGIDEARRRPQDFYVFTYDGKMGVVSKADLTHNLPHEGLHAFQAGAYNVNRAASNQEEMDGFRTGNAAMEALGLKPSTEAPTYGGNNPNYVPLFPPPAPPRNPAPRMPAKPAGLPHGYEYASADGGPRHVPLIGSPAVPMEDVDGDAVTRFEDVELFVASGGGSTGNVLVAYFVNHGKEPIRLSGDGIVLEPVDQPTAEDLARARAIEEAASGGKPLAAPERLVPGGDALLGAGRPANVVRVPIDAYCLDLGRPVPVAGTLFRIARRERQEEHGTARAILVSGRALHEEDQLHPDSDRVAYYHSIRQWAIGVDREGLDRARFEETFVDHTRKNFEAGGQEWTSDVERRVRELAPNRWSDITAILEGAGLRPEAP